MKTPLLFILAIFAIPVTYSQTIDNRLDSLLTETGIPVLYMTTDSGEEPKGNAVYPPSGAWGVGLTGNEDVTDELLENIKQYMLEFEELLVSKGNVGSMIDMGSFVSWLLAHDILGTGDSGGTNRYLYKYDFTSPTAKTTNSSLLKMGPLRDFDAVFKNEGRWASIHNVDYSFYFPHLLDIDEFKNDVAIG